ncbi:hypothetical protein [Thermoleptolyngbya sp.]
MNQAVNLSVQQRGQLRTPALIVFAFASVFFPRILESAGALAAINFLHFAIIPLVFVLTFTKIRSKGGQEIWIAQLLLLGLFSLLLSMAISAFLNKAGLVNLFIGYMLLAEPFLLLAAVVYTPMTLRNIRWMRSWILAFGFSNVLLALAQKLLITIGLLRVTRMTAADNIQGVFYLSGAGHVVSASVSLTFGLYYFASAKNSPLWLRATIVITTILQLLFADAKQTLLVFLAAWGVLILVKLTDIRVAIQYIISSILAFYSFLWALRNIPLFAAFNGWIRPGLYGPDGDATVLKLSGFPIIISFYENSLNWLWGLGPGHTVGRLGGWLLKEYSSLLNPLGATTRPVSSEVGRVWGESYLDSSFFSPLFGWIGIWGDFGLLGLGIYLFLWWVVWSFLCQDDFSKFTVITVFIFGFIFTQMEEPGYMLTVTTLIGLRWHELQVKETPPARRVHLRLA